MAKDNGSAWKIQLHDQKGRKLGVSCKLASNNASAAAKQVSSAKFSFGKLKLNKTRGTARLTVKVPDAGRLKLKKSEQVQGVDRNPNKAGKAKLVVRPKGKAAKRLSTKGKAKVRAEVSYRPSGASCSRTKTQKVTLQKRS
jgi:hypothetical protein